MDNDNINWELCDGLAELNEKDQESVREAIERGYVADEDWRGVCFRFFRCSCASGLIQLTGSRGQPPGSS